MTPGKLTNPKIVKAVHKMRRKKKTFAKIGSYFGHTEGWAQHICKTYNAATGEPLVTPKSRKGRRKLTPDQEECIRVMAESEPTASGRQIYKVLQEKGVIDCSERTVRSCLKGIRKLSAAHGASTKKKTGLKLGRSRTKKQRQEAADVLAKLTANVHIPHSSSSLITTTLPTESTDNITLYGWFRSSCSWRVRIALAWKGIKYENVPVSLQDGQQNKDEFRAKNPLGQVPALCVDGLVLTQSVAILEYLEETRPNNPLLPSNSKDRAQVRRIVETIVSGIQPHQNLPGLNIPPGTPEAWKFAWSKEWAQMHIKKGFAALEEMLKAGEGKFCVGDQVTLADVCLLPQVYNATMLGVNLSPYPSIVKISDELMKLEAFTSSAPRLQPDWVDESHRN